MESDGGSAEISQFMVEICGEIPDARFSSVEAERVRVVRVAKSSIYLHSTCSVTEEAESRSHQATARMSRRREVHR